MAYIKKRGDPTKAAFNFSEIRFLFHGKIAHHTHVFMFKVMTVIHKQPFKVLKGLNDFHSFTRQD
jgi:hypothetical protein